MARILDAFNKQLREPGLTYNVGLIVGGTKAEYNPLIASGTAEGKVNVIPAQAQTIGDIRTVTEEQYKGLQEKMRAIVAQHLPRTSGGIDFKDGYPSMPDSAGNRELLSEQEICRLWLLTWRVYRGWAHTEQGRMHRGKRLNLPGSRSKAAASRCTFTSSPDKVWHSRSHRAASGLKAPIPVRYGVSESA